MVTFDTFVSMFAVAFAWGITNPLMRLGSREIKKTQGSNLISQLVQEVIYLIRNWRFTVPFIINQCGSVLYMHALGISELTLLVPIVNALTFMFTAVTGYILGEEFNNRVILGCLFYNVWSDTLCCY